MLGRGCLLNRLPSVHSIWLAEKRRKREDNTRYNRIEGRREEGREGKREGGKR